MDSSNPLAWTDIKINLDMNLTGLNNYYTKTEVDNGLALKAPINNPTFTGTLVCPQLNASHTKSDFNEIKPPGLYHYDGGISNGPSNSLSFRSIEIGSADRYSQIAMPWDTEQMFFRSRANYGNRGVFTQWREVVHSGNINTFAQQGPDSTAALELKADKATTYTKTEVDNSLALKANQSTT